METRETTSRTLARTSRHRLLGTASLALVLAGVTGCTAGDDSETAAPQTPGSSTATTVPTTTSTGTPVPGDRSAVDPTRPYDHDEAKAWVADVVATIEVSPETTLQGGSSHLDPASTQSTFVDYQSLAPGEYAFWFACRGGGEVTFSIASGGVTSPTLSGPCTGAVQSGEFTAVEGGTRFDYSNAGDPIDWVTRFAPRSSATG